MAKLLAIETSSEACSVALTLDGETRETHEHAPMRHAELLLPAISGLLGQAGIPLSALDAIAFGQGPGSFTSLRIGIGVVQGLAWAADLPVVPCSSLAAVAQEAADRFGGSGTGICVAVDARMQEVFTAEFECAAGGLVRMTAVERVCSPAEVPRPAAPSFIGAGNGFERFEALGGLASRAAVCYTDVWPRASNIARLAIAWLADNDPLPPARAQPVYVRNEVATRPD